MIPAAHIARRPAVALLVPPIAWSLFFVLVYGITAIWCDHAAIDARPVGSGTFALVMALLAVLTLLPMLWTGAAARGALRMDEGGPLARIAFWMAVLFVVATLFLALPIALLDLPCR